MIGGHHIVRGWDFEAEVVLEGLAVAVEVRGLGHDRLEGLVVPAVHAV
jgi:hypothetical protein